MNVAISWSGGKDSCLALLKSIQDGHTPQCLITMIDALGYSRSNGVHQTVLQKQSDALEIPILFVSSDWENYEEKLTESLIKVRLAYTISACVFGDIDSVEHKEFEEKICKIAKIQSLLPLWGESRENVKNQLIDLGIKSKISVIKNDIPILKTMLGTSYDDLDFALLKEHNIDICGENGEFHTVVYKAEKLGLNIKLDTKGIHTLGTVTLCDFR